MPKAKQLEKCGYCISISGDTKLFLRETIMMYANSHENIISDIIKDPDGFGHVQNNELFFSSSLHVVDIFKNGE
jgi:hypothetical protein